MGSDFQVDPVEVTGGHDCLAGLAAIEFFLPRPQLFKPRGAVAGLAAAGWDFLGSSSLSQGRQGREIAVLGHFCGVKVLVRWRFVRIPPDHGSTTNLQRSNWRWPSLRPELTQPTIFFS